MDIYKSFLNKFLTSIVFIATFGFANQNQIEQLSSSTMLNREVDKREMVRVSNDYPQPYRSLNRDNFFSVLIDSSKNGYGLYSPYTNPIAYKESFGYFIAYRKWMGLEESSGYIGISQSGNGTNWINSFPINENLQDGTPMATGRYPSALLGDHNMKIAVWNEWTPDCSGGGDNCGRLFINYDQETWYIDYPDDIMLDLNNGCANVPCDPSDLWIARPILLDHASHWEINTVAGALDLSSNYYFIKTTIDKITGEHQNEDPVLIIEGVSGTSNYDFKMNQMGFGAIATVQNELNFKYKLSNDFGDTWSDEFIIIPDSLYYDQIFPLDTSLFAEWHLDTIGAYGGDGQSWWCGDSVSGGYYDGWLQALDLPTITIPTNGANLSAMMKWGIENPDTAGGSIDSIPCLDGWDAANVRISNDGGNTWDLLTSAENPYDFSYGYGWIYNDENYGCGGSLEHLAAGWGGQANWHEVNFDLSAYAGDDVIIRFAFGSDPAISVYDDSTLTGIWIDNINIEDVFSNDGNDESGITPVALIYSDVGSNDPVLNTADRFDMQVDQNGGLHFFNSIFYDDTSNVFDHNAAYYHLYNATPQDSSNWRFSYITDLSQTYQYNIGANGGGNSAENYLFPSASFSSDENSSTIWMLCNKVSEFDETNYTDLDIFLYKSIDYGSNWSEIGNLTNSLNDFETSIHAAPNSTDNSISFLYQIPDLEFNTVGGDWYEEFKQLVYFGFYGDIVAESENLVINEIMQNPSAVTDDSGEWFEIYNAGEYVISLQGYSIKDAGDDMHTIDDVIVLFPGQFKVFGNNADSNTNGDLTIDYQYSDISLGNGEDELIILDPDGTVIDSVSWDNGATFPDPNGASMALSDPTLDNSLGSNWQESTTPYGDGDLGTPGIPNFSSDIALDLTSLDFDTVNVSESGTLDLTISNAGNGSLHVDSLYTTSSLFTLSFTDSVIENSAILSVSFSPTGFGPATATLYIESNDPDESMVEILLTGYGYYPSPDIELESTSIDFGGVMDGLSITQSLEIYNTGETALEIDTVYCTGNFSVMPGSGTVDASDTLTLEVTFAPDDETTFEGELTIIATNDPDEDTLYVGLIGEGIPAAPEITLSPGTLDFGEEIVPGDTIMRQLIIYSTGVQTLEVEEIDFMNSDSNATLWTNFEDTSLEPGDSVIVDIYFHSPNTLYYSISTISIATNAGSIPITAIAGYYIKISDVTEDATNPINVEILINNDLPIALFYFEIDIPGDTLTLVNNSIMNTERTSGFSLEGAVNDNGNIDITGISLGSDLEPGIGPICSFTLDNNYNLENTYTLSFIECVIQDENFVDFQNILYRDGIITIVNLPPNPPTGISAEFNDGILLTWYENNEYDFSHYVLDKSNDELFETGQYSSITTTEISYLDTVYEDGQVLYYRLSAVDSAGNVSDFSDVVSFEVVLGIYDRLIPEFFALHQNYPNPFNPITQIKYDLPEDALVSINIYDIMGRSIRSLVNSQQTAGYRSIQWNATNNLGEPVSAGMYIYMIQAGEFRQTKKMVLLK
jgi:hypothetical protein